MRRLARMLSQSSTAQAPSFSRIWLEPVPKLSSPHSVARPASSRLPKNFHPVGVSKWPMPSLAATRSAAALVGIERATPCQALGVARRELRIGREHRQRIRGRDELAAADDEVAVAVAVRGRAEIGRLRRHQQIVEILGVGEVRVGVMAAEIGQRRSVDDRARRRAEFALEDRVGVGAGDRVHAVEAHAEAGGEQRADRIEVEQRPHQRRIFRHRIDDLDRRVAELRFRRAASRSTSGASEIL